MERAGMAGCDCSLQLIRPPRVHAALGVGAPELRFTAPYVERVPRPSVLFEQEHWLARGARPCAKARRLEFHQRDDTVDFGLVRRERGQTATEPQCLTAELGPHPLGAR